MQDLQIRRCQAKQRFIPSEKDKELFVWAETGGKNPTVYHPEERGLSAITVYCHHLSRRGHAQDDVLLGQIKRPKPFLAVGFLERKKRNGPQDAALLLLFMLLLMVVEQAGVSGTGKEHTGGQQKVPYALHRVNGQGHRGICSICSRCMVLVNVSSALVS